MSAHRCFDIPELLEKIAHAVSESPHSYDSGETRYIDKPDVLSLATVSQRFSKHALDILWSDIDNINPFKCVLPQGLITIPEDDTADQNINLTTVGLAQHVNHHMCYAY